MDNHSRFLLTLGVLSCAVLRCDTNSPSGWRAKPNRTQTCNSERLLLPPDDDCSSQGPSRTQPVRLRWLRIAASKLSDVSCRQDVTRAAASAGQRRPSSVLSPGQSWISRNWSRGVFRREMRAQKRAASRGRFGEKAKQNIGDKKKKIKKKARFSTRTQTKKMQKSTQRAEQTAFLKKKD